MKRELKVSLFDLATSLSNAMDLISSDIVNHHKRVAYIALKIAKELKLPAKDIDNIVLAGILHDVGALSFKERLTAKQYEFENANNHAEVGYWLLKNFELMHDMAENVRYHHCLWDDGKGEYADGQKVPIGAHILHLADRIEILINRNEEILGQVKRIVSIVIKGQSKVYAPHIVDAFLNLSHCEYFWLDIVSPNIDSILAGNTDIASFKLEIDTLLQFTKLFSQIIDFRSSFTATHSSGVAYTSEALARVIGLSDYECQTMRIAGFLHDLGKLAIPREILEKPAGLVETEFNVIRSHTYHTYRILSAIPGFQQITEWAAFHHEKLNGKGYPFHLKGDDLTLGARIMAVADVFTAITEDRPYRTGLEREKVLSILTKMVDNGALDKYVVNAIKDNYDEINEIRIQAQADACKSYNQFKSGIDI
jgi:HD-GYP domain-containing protein (c-di-GMP phosphodiesterase class II)